MFKRPEDPIKKALDNEILNLLVMMNNKDGDKFDDEYDKMTNAVTKLYELRSKEKVSMETIVNAVTHLTGLLVIMQHERVHVIASKAFGLIKKIV